MNNRGSEREGGWSKPPHFAILDGAAERRAAWQSSADPDVRDRAYATVLRRQFNAKTGEPRKPDDVPDGIDPATGEIVEVVEVVDVEAGEYL